MTEIQERAFEKIEREYKAYRPDRYGKIMGDYIQSRLKEFCEQNEEFAQAVLDGGSFGECMNSITSGIGQGISDLDACQKAVKFYFPDAVIEFEMKIFTSVWEAEEPESAGIVLNLEDFF